MLYFDNLSPDTADAYLADGLTEEIIARLGQIARLTVKSRTAVQRYRRTATDPVVLGRDLGVAHLVSGSVRRAGSRLRVTVELTRAASGVRVWGDQYQRPDSDLFAIQEDIARAVAHAVGGQLLPRERALLAVRPTRNPAAYDHFLRGNYHLAQRSRRSVARAIEEYRAGLSLDPELTPALSRIALAYSVFLERGWAYSGLPAESLVSRGLVAVDRALRQDSTAADAWTARGSLLTFRFPRTYEGVLASFGRAIAIDSGNAEAHHFYGWRLLQLGEDSAALAAFHRALAVEPGRAITLVQIARVSELARRLDEARRWLDSALAADPGFYLAYARRAAVRLHLGETAEARADAETALRLGVDDPLWGEGALALVEVRLGDTVAARARVERLLREAVDRDRPTSIEGSAVGTGLVALGDHERALDLLERVHPRGAALWLRLREPGFDAVRSHPRFQRLVEQSRPR